MSRIFAALVAGLFLIVPSISSANPIAGSENPEYQAAVEAWLAGEDMNALRSFATLARDGNTAAKILLSRIADTPHMSQHIWDQLPRKERIELFREPKGLSGKDWLASASIVNELAYALWVIQSQSLDEPDFNKIIPTLIENREIKQAYEYLLEMWKHGRAKDAADVLTVLESEFGDAGRHLLALMLHSMVIDGLPVRVPSNVTSQADFESYLSELQNERNTFTASGRTTADPGRSAHPSRPEDRKRLATLVRSDPSFRPLLVFCERTCAASKQERCLAEGSWAMSFGTTFPYPFSSPAPSLIEDARYWASDRLMGDISRILEKGKWRGCE